MLHYVVSDYLATGEGMTRCILITKAYPAHDDYKQSNSHYNEDGTFHFEMPELKDGITSEVIAMREFKKEFGDFYAMGAEYLDEEEFLRRYAAHLPSHFPMLIADQHDPNKGAGNFYYASKLHLNYS